MNDNLCNCNGRNQNQKYECFETISGLHLRRYRCGHTRPGIRCTACHMEGIWFLGGVRRTFAFSNRHPILLREGLASSIRWLCQLTINPINTTRKTPIHNSDLRTK